MLQNDINVRCGFSKSIFLDSNDSSSGNEIVLGGQDSEVQFNEEQIEDTGDYVASEVDESEQEEQEDQNEKSCYIGYDTQSCGGCL